MNLIRDALKFDYVYAALFRNAILILFGASFYAIYTNTLNPLNLLVAIVAFVIGYPAVYVLNDFMDAEKDKHEKDPIQLKRKPLATGAISTKQAVSIMFLLLVAGFMILNMLNFWARFFFVLAFLANFVHSSVYLRWRDKGVFLATSTVLIMQASKVLLGWFSQTPSFEGLPLSGIAFISAAYASAYYIIGKGRVNFFVQKGKRFGLDNRIIIRDPKEVLVSLLVFLAMSYLLIAYFPYKLFSVMVIMSIIIVLAVYNLKMNRLIAKRALKVLFVSGLFLTLVFYANFDIGPRFDDRANTITARLRIGDEFVEQLDSVSNETVNVITKELEKQFNLTNLTRMLETGQIELIISLDRRE